MHASSTSNVGTHRNMVCDLSSEDVREHCLLIPPRLSLKQTQVVTAYLWHGVPCPKSLPLYLVGWQLPANNFSAWHALRSVASHLWRRGPCLSPLPQPMLVGLQVCI